MHLTLQANQLSILVCNLCQCVLQSCTGSVCIIRPLTSQLFKLGVRSSLVPLSSLSLSGGSLLQLQVALT